jgi:hypothetical protein
MALLELLPINVHPFVGLAGLVALLVAGTFLLRFVFKIVKVVGLIGCLGVVTVTLLAIIVMFERR